MMKTPTNAPRCHILWVATIISLTNGGEFGLQLIDDNGNAEFTLKFVGGEASWKINDGGDDFGISQGFSANTTYSFTFTYDDDNNNNSYSYVFESASGNNFTFQGTNDITSIKGFKIFSFNQGYDQNFGFNNISVTSLYTITGSQTCSDTRDIPYLTVKSGGSLTIAKTGKVTVNGALSNSGTITLNS